MKSTSRQRRLVAVYRNANSSSSYDRHNTTIIKSHSVPRHASSSWFRLVSKLLLSSRFKNRFPVHCDSESESGPLTRSSHCLRLCLFLILVLFVNSFKRQVDASIRYCATRDAKLDIGFDVTASYNSIEPAAQTKKYESRRVTSLWGVFSYDVTFNYRQ